MRLAIAMPNFACPMVVNSSFVDLTFRYDKIIPSKVDHRLRIPQKKGGQSIQNNTTPREQQQALMEQ
jgi:hypothetical protein